MISSSGVMQEVFRLIEKAADSTMPVILLGEPGVGKERLAEEIAAYKDRLDIAKEMKAEQEKLAEKEKERSDKLKTEQDKLAEAEGAKAEENKQRDLAENGERVAERIDQWGGEVTRAREDRLMTARDRRDKSRNDMKKARDHAFTEDELAAIRKRQKEFLPLTKAEERALAEDEKFAEKAEKIRDKQRSGAKLSRKDEQILREAGAQADLKQAQADKAQNERDMADKKILDKRQADDIEVIKNNIIALLALK